MWLLSFFSDLIIHTVTVIGLIGVLASFFVPTNPLSVQYGVIVKIISVILLTVGIFFEGTIFKDKIWEARVAEAQAHIAELEKQSAVENVKIQYVYTTKKEYIKQVDTVVKGHIKTDAEKIDSFCIVVPEAVSILNTSAKNESTGVTK